jgi:translocation and assembly module TamB
MPDSWNNICGTTFHLFRFKKPWMKEHLIVKKAFITFLKVIAWLVFSITLILVAIALLIQVPAVQNKIIQRAISYLHEKIGTEVRLEHISVSFPKEIVLTGLYLEDQRRDTLLYAGKLAVDTDLWDLINKRIGLNSVESNQLSVHVSRGAKDSAYNFTYIVNAFAGDTVESNPKDTVTSPWTFSLEGVELTSAKISYQDSLSGDLAEGSIGELKIEMNEFNPDKSKYKASNITLKNINATILLTKSASSVQHETSESSLLLPDLSFERIELENNKVSYTNQIDGQVVQLNLGKAEIEANYIKLPDQVIQLENIQFVNSFFSYQQMKAVVSKGIPADTTEINSELKPWKINVNSLDLSGLVLQYYDFGKPVITNSIDYNHLWISRFGLKGSKFSLNGNEVAGEVKEFFVFEKSGFSISSFQSQFSLKENKLEVNNFHLTTPGSRIDLTAKANFTSLTSIAKTYPEAFVDLKVKSSALAIQDILFFQPRALDSIPLKLNKSFILHADIIAEGKINDLTFKKLNLHLLDSTKISLEGNIKGLPDIQQALMNIKINELYTTDKNIQSVLPDSLLSKNIHLPPWMSVKAKFKGTIYRPDLVAALTSSSGSIALNTKMNLSPSKNDNYKGEIKVTEFKVGEVLGDTAMGKLDMTASITGSGMKLDNINAAFDVVVNHFEYKHYDYRNFKLNGSMKKYFFSGIASLQDKNLDVRLEGDLDYNKDVPEYKLTLELRNADLQALNLSERPLKAKGTVDVNLATRDFKLINGNLAIKKFGVYNGQELYLIDSLMFASIDQEGQSEISIRSDMMTGDFKGTINLYALPGTIRRHFNNYFSLKDTAYNKEVAPQNFKFKLEIKNTDLFTEVLFPEMEPFVPGEMSGEFDSEEEKLELRFGITKIKYGSLGVDSVRFKVLSDKDELTYTFSIRNLSMDTLRIAGLRFSGNVAGDSIHTRFAVIDSVRDEKYVFGGAIRSLKDAYQFHFLNDELVLNYEEWKTPEDNYLKFSKSKLQPHHFEISNGDEKISLQNRPGADSVLSMVFSQLELKDVTSLVQGVTPVAGVAEGDVNVSTAEQGAFTSKLKIQDFTILGQTWGNLSLALSQKPNLPFDIDLGVQGENVELKITGNYTSSEPNPAFKLIADIKKINLSAFQPLTLGKVKEMNGNLTGEIKAEGSLSKPDLTGTLNFKEVTVVPVAVNTPFTLKDETLEIKNGGLIFSQFKIRDEKDNAASIDGTIGSSNFKSFRLNLDIETTDFQLLNSTYKDNKLFYGKVGITTNIKVRGSSIEPKVTMNVKLTDKSNFSFVVPQSEKGVQDQKGIVTFVDKDAETDPFLASIQPNDTVMSAFRGVDLTANIELAGGETFNIVLDPASGDQLSVRGSSNLTLVMSAAGDMQLTGRYEIVSGTYDFSFYKLVKRNFTIEKGSTISWLGDPMEAQLDVRALYRIETSPLELVSNQIDFSNSTELNTYRQRLPFLVYLMVKGDLLAPEITFKLDMPVDKQNAFGGNVYASIQDLNTRESDLNKQVFALLVLKRFITENPLESQSGGDVEGTARTSVSKILTDQLNRLSQNVKGVQLSFDVKSYQDYTTGTAQGQTQLQLGVSKSLFNNRLVVKVSGNLDLEGENTSEQHSAADYIGDLALEYKITNDGRFRISGFRNSNYDMIDGELTETGAGLIYIKDYNALSELFKANEKTGN